MNIIESTLAAIDDDLRISEENTRYERGDARSGRALLDAAARAWYGANGDAREGARRVLDVMKTTNARELVVGDNYVDDDAYTPWPTRELSERWKNHFQTIHEVARQLLGR